MKHFFAPLTLGLMALSLVATSGCKLSDCDPNQEEDADGVCVQGKSLTKFDGTDVPKTVSYQAGGSVTVSAVYGNVTIEGGAAAGTVEVIFKPFDFEAYDEKELATRQMNENLDLKIADGANIDVTAARKGDPTNGLGTSVTIKLPPEFDGNLTVLNHGDGPLANAGEFDVDIKAVAGAKTVTLTNKSALGDCSVNGAASVVSTGVTCHGKVAVLGVSDDVNITTDGEGMDDPSVVLRVVGVSAAAKGGKVSVTDEGSIDATFPASGSYSVHASAPSGAVDPGAPPASCTVSETTAADKTVACGSGGPVYDLSTNGTNGSVFLEGNVKLSYK
jgi:hypothetical protein